jgi:hypothetical protein
MLRVLALALASVAAIAWSVKPVSCVADTVDAAATEPLKVVLLPARAHVSRVGLMQADEEEEEWSALARANLDAAVLDLVGQSSAFSPTALPPVSSEERNAIDEFVAVANLATTKFGGVSLWGGVGVQRATADRTLGPSLAFLHDQTGADFAIGTFAFQLEQSKRLAAVTSTIGLGLFAGGGIVSLPTVTFSYLAMFVADLRTGELRWFNVESGYEVAGYNFSDLRDPESVSKMVGKLLESCQDASQREDSKTVPKARPTRPASPDQGEFAVQAPLGWRVSESENRIRATRDGRALNEMNVELRDHNRAFLTIGRRTTRNSPPEKLAEWFVEDLKQQELAELQIIDVSTDAQLVGKPAFRVRYSYRLPLFNGGARIELVAIGTAVPNGVLIAQLDAPQLGYFAKALPAFEEAVRSVVLKPRRYLQ